MLWQQPQTLCEAQPTSFPSLPPSLPLLGSWGESMFNLQRSVFKVTFQPGVCAADLPTRFNFCPHGVFRSLRPGQVQPASAASFPSPHWSPPHTHTQATAWEVTFLSVPVNENIECLL